MKLETKLRLRLAFLDAIKDAENEIEAQLLRDCAYELNIDTSDDLLETLGNILKP